MPWGLIFARELESLDLNPYRVVSGDRHMVLDAKVVMREQSSPMADDKPDTSHLDMFFKARSVALIGASASPGKIGNAALDSLARHQYKGRVYPVNPRRAEVMGVPAYPSLAAVPGVVDMVVVTVNLQSVPEIIEQCATKGVHNLVVVSGGGKELGEDGGALEARIRRLGKQHDVRIIGCNCIGVFDGRTRREILQTHERMKRPRKGRSP